MSTTFEVTKRLCGARAQRCMSIWHRDPGHSGNAGGIF